MVHLRPLPGSPRWGGSLQAVRDAMHADAQALVAGGVTALMIENFGDTPFHRGSVPVETVAHMANLASDLRQRLPEVPLGINVLRNDGCAALAIAHAAGARFIRVNILCGARVTDQGLIQGIAAELLRLRAQLGAEHIAILADVNVKHSAPLAAGVPLEQEVADLIHRGGADALIVTGSGTGTATPLGELKKVKAAAGSAPVLVGSGITAATVSDYLPLADGFIVGTALKLDPSRIDSGVDVQKVRDLVMSTK